MNKRISPWRELLLPTGAQEVKLFQRRPMRVDAVLLVLITALSLFGTLMIFSAGSAYAQFRYQDAYYFVRRQTLFLVIGYAIMLVFSRIRIDFIYRYAAVFFYITIFLLILVLVVGFVGNGAKRWIQIGPLTIQPSEIAKLTMVLFLSKYYTVFENAAVISKKEKAIFLYSTIIPFSIIACIILLVMLQKHLSCIIILGMIGISLMVVSGARLRYLYSFLGLGVGGVSAFALLTDYTKERITVWQNPEAYKLTGGWQTLQGLMAIGSGGLGGLGLGGGLLKYCYISEPANDMIFTVLCEELGVIGAGLCILLFAALIFRGFWVARGADGAFSRLVAFGITVKIAIQVVLNIAVVTNTIPNTGISLPFFSYGGSSLLMIMAECGILLSISREVKTTK